MVTFDCFYLSVHHQSLESGQRGTSPGNKMVWQQPCYSCQILCAAVPPVKRSEGFLGRGEDRLQWVDWTLWQHCEHKGGFDLADVLAMYSVLEKHSGAIDMFSAGGWHNSPQHKAVISRWCYCSFSYYRKCRTDVVNIQFRGCEVRNRWPSVQKYMARTIKLSCHMWRET